MASLSAAVDYEAQHRKLRGRHHGGTGMWLIQHPIYVAWKQSTTSEGLFLHGIRKFLTGSPTYHDAHDFMEKRDQGNVSSREFSGGSMHLDYY